MFSAFFWKYINWFYLRFLVGFSISLWSLSICFSRFDRMANSVVQSGQENTARPRPPRNPPDFLGSSPPSSFISTSTNDFIYYRRHYIIFYFKDILNIEFHLYEGEYINILEVNSQTKCKFYIFIETLSMCSLQMSIQNSITINNQNRFYYIEE